MVRKDMKHTDTTPLITEVKVGNPSERGVFIGCCLLGALLSLIATGFVFGINNNVFHLPIVSSLYDEPQFAQDPFIQSLRYFASGVWLLLKGADRYVEAYWLFLVGDYLSRVIAFAGFLSCASLLGVNTLKQRVFFSLILSFTGLLEGEAYAGGGSIFNNYFTHSEIANGLTLLSLSLMIRGRIVWSHGMNGMVFFVNAFVAVWNIVPLSLIMLGLYIKNKADFRRIVSQSLLGLVLFILIATPVIMNVFSNPEFGKEIDFDFVVFLTQYWPYHTLFSAMTLKHKIAVVLIVSLGLISFSKLGASARPFLAVLIGYMAVYAVGIAVPHFTNNPAILNLHLLRVSTLFHIMAALGSISLAVKWFEDRDDNYRSNFLAPIFIVLLCTMKLVLITPIFILVSSSSYVRRLTPGFLIKNSAHFASLMAGLTIVLQIHIAWINNTTNSHYSQQVSEFASIGKWARANTPINSIFLVITQNHLPSSHTTPRDYDNTVFQYTSHRVSWVDFKSGAAVMWSPSYYHTWYPRIEEVLSLKSLKDKIAYAKKNSISYVIDHCDKTWGYDPLFSVDKICLYSATDL